MKLRSPTLKPLFVTLLSCGTCSPFIMHSALGEGSATPEIRGGYELPRQRPDTESETPTEDAVISIQDLERAVGRVAALRAELAQAPGNPEPRAALLAAIRSKYSITRQLLAAEIQRAETEVASRTDAVRRIDAADRADDHGQDSTPAQVRAAREHTAAFLRYCATAAAAPLNSQVRVAVDALDQRTGIVRASLHVQNEHDQLSRHLRRDLELWRQIAKRLRLTIGRLAAREDAEIRSVISLYS